jgi:hypothetical protein
VSFHQSVQPALPAPAGRPSVPSLRAAVEAVASAISLSGWRALLLDLAVLLVAMIPLLWPLTAPGYLEGADAIDHPWRSLVIGEALRNGTLYPRWSPEFYNGWGFPFFNFYSPLSFYPAALMNLWFATDLLDATKLAFAGYLVAAGVGAYTLARTAVGSRSAAILAGVLYVYSPFVASEVYVRSNLAGLSGIALLPFALAVFVRLVQRPSLLLACAGALMIALLIPSHNVTSLVTAGMVAVIALLYFWKARNWRVLLMPALGLALGLGIASFFWAPALGERSLVYTDMLYSGDFHYGFHFVNPVGPTDTYIHWAGRWQEDYRLTSVGPLDLHPAYPYGPPPYKLGLLQGLLLVLGAAALVLVRTRPFMVAVFMVLALVLGFLHLSWSRVLWDTVPMLNAVQYPWRLTGPMGLCLAIVAAWALSMLIPRRRAVAMVVVGAAAAASSLWLLPTALGPFHGGPEVTIQGLRHWEYHSRNRFGTMVDSQFMPLAVRWDNSSRGDIVFRYEQSYPLLGWVDEVAWVEPGKPAWILAARRGHQWMEAEVEAGEATTIAFRTIYFPGWTAYVDGKPAAVEPSGWVEYEERRSAALGVVEVRVPPGRHLVRLVFEDTPIRAWSKGASLASLGALGLVFGVGLSQRRRVGASVRTPAAIGIAALLSAGLLYGWAVVPRDAEWVVNSVVVDMVEEAKGRVPQLEITVPAGGKPDDYVHPRKFDIGGEAREVVYMHPPAMVTRRMWLPDAAVLSFAVGIDPEVWSAPGDGVEFVVELREGGRMTPLFSAYLDPKSNPADRRWVEAQVDLSGYARRDIELVLRTLPGASGDHDWAGWASPKVSLR